METSKLNLNRRQAVKMTATLLGVGIIGADFFLSGCARKATKIEGITESVINLLDEVGETILPETPDSPGAKAAQIGLFIKAIVEDCYSPAEQHIFITGINTLEERAMDQYNTIFVDLPAETKLELLSVIDVEASKNEAETPIHYFSMMKQLTLWGYFSSEIGATQALRYNKVPQEFKGCIPYKEGDKAWA